VHVVGRADGDGVEFIGAGEQFAPVAMEGRFGMLFAGGLERAVIDVAKGDDFYFLVAGDAFHRAAAHAADADGCDLERAVGGGTTKNCRSGEEGAGGGGGLAEEAAT